MIISRVILAVAVPLFAQAKSDKLVQSVKARAKEPPPVSGKAQTDPFRRWVSSGSFADIYDDCAAPPEELRDPKDQALSKPVNGKKMWRRTQALKGEEVVIDGNGRDGWVHVSVPRQRISGWVHSSALGTDSGLASSFPPSSEGSPERKAFLQATKELEDKGTPYVWGGTSEAGVDCSGLVVVGFTKIGKSGLVPRTAKEQYAGQAKKGQELKLKAGDLIFTAKSGSPESISHVMVYIGEGRIREAQQPGTRVLSTDAAGRLGFALQDDMQVEQGKPGGGGTVYFGTYFQD
ncbi:MAG: C40 family peptidase [Elusimicrobiota bacterium]